MAGPARSRLVALIVSWAIVARLVCAQETVFASVAFVRTGERLPRLDAASNVTTLTPFGAQQMLSLGSMFRDRYMPQNTSGIHGLSVNEIDQQQTYFLADDHQYSLASAQAFLQALYPPYSPSTQESSGLANGTSDQFPLGGYQYPLIQTVSPSDARSIYVDGSYACVNFIENEDYSGTTSFQDAESNSQELFSRLAATLESNDLPSTSVVFSDAFDVYDYLAYSYNHNSTVYDILTNGTLAGDLDQLRAYSNEYLWGWYGQSQDTSSSTSELNTIAGRTFASGILGRFATAIQTEGEQSKMSILFGEFPAMLSFAALTQLPAADQNFYGMPSYGSTMIFELFSPNDTNIGTSDAPSDLRVRFLFANGTDTIDQSMPTNLTTYPLWGSSDLDMSLQDFSDAISGIAVDDPGSWCGICNSWDAVPFCSAYNTTTANAVDSQSYAPTSSFKGTMSAPLAGVVGAVTTLAALCIFIVFAVGCCGMTVVQRKRLGNRSGTAATTGKATGGFKGSRKLASDADVQDMKPNEHRKSGVTFGNAGENAMGHERVGSWELKTPGKAASTRSRDEEDALGFESLGKEVLPAERI